MLLCSYEAARAAGVADDRMVFLHAGADAHDHWFVTERAALAEAPAIGIAARAALGAAGIGVDDIARFDLYSCFPAAVEMAMHALGLRGRRARRRTSAHRHRRTRLRGRTGEQLPDARDRAHGRRAAAPIPVRSG